MYDIGMNKNLVNKEIYDLRLCKERLREQMKMDLMNETCKNYKHNNYNLVRILLHYMNKSKRSLCTTQMWCITNIH